MNQQKNKDKSHLLAIFLLSLAAFFVFLFLLPENEKSKTTGGSVRGKQFEDRVNRHLFKTSQKMELHREKMRLEADLLASRGVESKAADPAEVRHLDLSTDPRAEALLQALGRETRESKYPTNPDELVQAELFESQQFQAYSEEYKKEYARQFIENARKAGYLIKLSDDYKVISVRPLRKPADNFELFQNKGRAYR